jgi:hypothetical protein
MDSLAAQRGFGRCDGGFRADDGFLPDGSRARKGKSGSVECVLRGVGEQKVLGMLWGTNVVPAEVGGV